MKIPPVDLRTLRDELAATTSPRLKLKLLAHAWRTVRELSAEDRRALASEIGMQEAQGVLDNLAHSKGGRAAGRILERLGLSGVDEPLDLPGLVRDLTSESDRPPDRTFPENPPVIRSTRKEVADSPAPPPPARRDLAEPAPAPAPPPRRIQPARIPAPDKSEDPGVPAEKNPVSTSTPHETDPPFQASPRLSERIRSVGPLISRFRILRESLDGQVPLEDSEIEDVLASFPEGWARRRALSGLFRSGHPASLTLALSLIEGLAPAWHRRWSAEDLLRSRPLTPEEEELVRQRTRIGPVSRVASGDSDVDNVH